jgi:hypothetical protein
MTTGAGIPPTSHYTTTPAHCPSTVIHDPPDPSSPTLLYPVLPLPGYPHRWPFCRSLEPPRTGCGRTEFRQREADPFEGRNARREREVRALLDKLAPDTIVLDPEIIGGVAEGAQRGLGTEGVAEVYRKLPRLERLRVSGKADESEVVDPLDAKVDEEESGEGFNGLSEKEKKAKREEERNV